MLDRRRVQLDLFGLALGALTLFLAVSLWTYHPADPPTRLVFPPHEQPVNLCGPVGVWAAHLLLAALGLGAYYLVASLTVFDTLLLVRRPISQPGVRLVGWLLSLCGLATLAAMALPTWSPGPVIGSGGYLGAVGRGLLEMNFATAGAYILAASVVLGGLLLCTDYFLIRLALWPLARPLAAVRQLGSKSPAKKSKASKAVEVPTGEDEDEEEEVDEYEEDEEDEGEEDEEPTIRITRRQRDDEADDQKSRAGVGRRLADVLRIKPNGRKRDPRAEVIEEIEAASRECDEFDYELPPHDLLLESEPFSFEEHEKDVRRKARILEKTFANFGFAVKVVEIETGPVIAQFEVELEAGLRLSKITGLADDLAIALRVPSVRIVAPIPGKNTVGIEVPNAERQLVRLREVMEEANGKAQRMRIPIYLGKDVAGNPLVFDLTTLPHLLIAGRTGTGKSVCLNTIIMSMLMTRGPDEVRMLLIDPKMVELSPYMKLPHLMHPVVTDMKKAEAILGWAVEKMDERYALLARAGVRHVSTYNQLGAEEIYDRIQPETEEEKAAIPTHLPFIVIVADEMADLMMTAAKEVEGHIIRLAQKSRAVGIHLVLATQKPTVDVITGLIKSNLPARVAFQVASRTDSRVVLDEMGADKLLGNGDLLFLWPGTSALLRGQGAFVSDDEIMRVVDFVGTNEPRFVHELVHLPVAGAEGGAASQLKNRDELYEAAVDIVVREGRGSVSLLQRSLGIGYGRAARLIDYMAEDGIVGQYNGSQARDVLISPEDWEAMQGSASESNAPPSLPPSPPRNRQVPTIRPAVFVDNNNPNRSAASRWGDDEVDEETDEAPFDDDEELEDDETDEYEEDESELDDEEESDDEYDEDEGEDEEYDEDEEYEDEEDEYEYEDEEYETEKG